LKVSRRKTAENREALVGAAKKLLGERGFDGAGVAEISRQAGLTQGALYGQFGSKDALAVEAARKAFADGAAAWEKLRDKGPDALSAYLDAYLCEAQVRGPGSVCSMAACVSEIPRQDPAISAAFGETFETMVALIRRALPADMPEKAARRRALALTAAMIGSMATARAVAGADPGLARRIIAAVKIELGQLARRR